MSGFTVNLVGSIALVLAMQSSISGADQLKQTAYTRVNANRLEKFIGVEFKISQPGDMPWLSGTDSKRIYSYHYRFDRGLNCRWTYYTNKQNIIEDIEISGNSCFGEGRY